ncbi:hypothetical protein [Saccharothrix sp. ST-888]|uniref:hypothetical protein n=1 Tax=Saccharothrix sp. ST-888 TaxID=1427391 RepID=UPI0005ECA6CA|nr:hypothetical protein [Saccharothrix sp. ST-888]KJK58341.1 hypothetical protein UK12_11160 [Saccharothrix sp. ST-888]
MTDQTPVITVEQIAALLADVQLAQENGTPATAAVAQHPAVARVITAALPVPAQPSPVPVPALAPPVPAGRPVGQYLAAGAGAAAVLIPILLATTAALIAAGMAALSLAVTALVIRWIIRDMRRG